jgi:hypothetical protein
MVAKYLGAGVLVILLAACSFLTAGGDSSAKCMVVRQYPSLHELGRYHFGSLRTFALTFIHSVSKTPVRDEYDIDDSNIIQTAEIFEAHGAGLPSDIQDPGAVSWENRDGRFILHLKRPIPQLVVRTDRNYKNRLLLGRKEINLCQWEDQALELSVKFCGRLD